MIDGHQTALSRLGSVSAPVAEGLARVLAQQSGLILVASPTGCGKHRTAKAIRDAKTQEQLMFDEVRSSEQARALIDAAASGLAIGVLSGLNATGAWLRVQDMCERTPDPTLLLAAHCISSLAVRLVPALCSACRVVDDRPLPHGSATYASQPSALRTYRKGAGCGRCSDGVVGRALVAEIVQRDGLSKQRWSSGPLWADGLRQVVAGRVTFDDAETFCGTPDDGSEYGEQETTTAWR